MVFNQVFFVHLVFFLNRIKTVSESWTSNTSLQASQQTLWVNITTIWSHAFDLRDLEFRCWCFFEAAVNYLCSKVSSTVLVMLIRLVQCSSLGLRTGCLSLPT